MLNTKMENEIEIAVRLYDNKLYGTTYGKGLYRKAIYNGSIDINESDAKYVIDLFSYDDWCNQAKTDEQMAMMKNIEKNKDNLYSWINRYDRISKQKTLVDGCVVMNAESNDMVVALNDTDFDVVGQLALSAKPCKQSTNGRKSPMLLASNSDLTEWKASQNM